jgi:uncharacterized protein (TIGR02145 family)
MKTIGNWCFFSLCFLLLYLMGCTSENPGIKSLPGDPVVDIEGNIYQTVIIDHQTWMAENLRTTRYRDSTEIPLVLSDAVWDTLRSEGFSWYLNDPVQYSSTYGALYNFYVVETGKLCPMGWHVPSEGEWQTLSNYLGGWEIAGGPMKEEGYLHWEEPNEGATNASGFSALPAGGRLAEDGVFEFLGRHARWWSSTISGNAMSWTMAVFHNKSYAFRTDLYHGHGMSVRCIRD